MPGRWENEAVTDTAPNPTGTSDPEDPGARPAPSQSNRSTTPTSDAFRSFIASGWADRDTALPPAREQAPYAAGRRAVLAARYPGRRLVIRAGETKTRSNDTDYPFRADSAFSHLTGWGSDTEPGSVLVLDPLSPADPHEQGSARPGDGPDAPTHRATLYFRPAAGRDSDEFYANPAIGEFWIGARPTLEQVAAELAIDTADLADFAEGEDDMTPQTHPELERDLSELRLVKDEYEIRQLREAVTATARGFDDIVADLPRIAAHVRGERLVEGVFATRARLEGNDVGYGTIAASGPHACILHWTRNDGPVLPGDLILVDAGVELDSLYTADITRTLPVSGAFSPVQRMVYEAVLEAADAAFAIVRPGIRFREVHEAAMAVIARVAREWGLAGDADPEHAYHRRYMVHSTSHHLGLDVHDCARARRELYLDGVLEPGMVFTIEPGLYFQPDDLTVPEDFRGIGVRIEDDILVTADGAERLSAGIPRTPGEVEQWLRRGHEDRGSGTGPGSDSAS